MARRSCAGELCWQSGKYLWLGVQTWRELLCHIEVYWKHVALGSCASERRCLWWLLWFWFSLWYALRTPQWVIIWPSSFHHLTKFSFAFEAFRSYQVLKQACTSSSAITMLHFVLWAFLCMKTTSWSVCWASWLVLGTGVFSYLSYRDPNLIKTLDNYDGTVDFLKGLELDEDALTKAIIGTIGDVDSYQLPDAKGYSRFVH